MSLSNINYINLNNIFRNIDSEKIGFYFSFCLHLIFLIFIIGFPSFFKPAPINIPAIIPIEIINVSETTSIPKKNNIINDAKRVETNNEKRVETKATQSKFNNVQPELIKKVEVKAKPEKRIEKIIVKEKKTIKPVEKNLAESNIKKQNIQEEQFESVTTKKIKPRIKPKPKNIESITQDTDINVVVRSKPRPNFNIASMLKDLRKDQSLINDIKIENDTKKDKIKDANESNKLTSQLSISEIDLLIRQLSSCWSAPAGAVIKKGMVVKVSAQIKRDGKVLYESVRIVDTNIPQSNPFYGPITESAMRTLLNPECNPLLLPNEKYDLWKNITIIFDHSIMKGYQ